MMLLETFSPIILTLLTVPPLSLPGEAGAQCRHLQTMLDEKNAAVARLTERLMNLDVDVAILVADRGR